MLQQTIEETHVSFTPGELDRIPAPRAFADSDAALVEALKMQAATAFDVLVKRYERRLMNVAMRITKNHEDAEDVVQESFLKVFKNIDRFRGDCKFGTWLTQIAINQALMIIRSNNQKFVSIDEGMALEDRFATPEPAASGYTPEQLYSQHEFEDVVLNLTNVRKSSRQVMNLYINHDLSDGEISQVLSLTLSAVKARLHRGRLDLREAMSRRFCLTNLARACKNTSPATAQRTNPLEDVLSNGNQEQRPDSTTASGLAPDNLLPAQHSRSSCQVQSFVSYQVDPQLLTHPAHSSAGRPTNCV